MMYNMKYFNENSTANYDCAFAVIYKLDEHTIAISRCRNPKYCSVDVDGKTISTRTLTSNAIRFALNYLNAQ